MARIHSHAARTIGGRIRSARQEGGISMDDLSDLAELSLTSIGKIERGAQSPTTETLVRIAWALNLPAGDLIRDLTPDDFGGRSHRLTARDLIREREREHRG